MKSRLCFAASAFALIAGLVLIALFMEMYDVKPQTWGPQGVEFAEWHRAWSARRDLYILSGAGSLCTGMVLCLVGVVRRKRRITKPGCFSSDLVPSA